MRGPPLDFGLSVPANLLLAGEYFVTEEGGLGLALAAAPRARIRAGRRKAGGPVLEARMGPGSFTWSPGEAAPPLISAVLLELEALLGARGRGAGPSTAAEILDGVLLEIDSSAFFAPDGSKRGLGSSAAVALGLSAALLRLAGLEGEELEEAILPVALRAHRRAQGGRGSGYDLYASRHGGYGLFVGGALPRWIPAPREFGELLGTLDLALLRGPAPVSSPQALLRYGAWKTAEPAAWEETRRKGEDLVRRLSETRDPAGFLELLGAAATAGASLGRAIGVPAAAPPLDGGVAKCLGAGDELVLVARGTVTAPRGTVTAAPAEVLIPESEGLRWE